MNSKIPESNPKEFPTEEETKEKEHHDYIQRENKKICDFQNILIKLDKIEDKELIHYLNKSDLLYGNLGHIYYRMSVQINKFLLEYSKKGLLSRRINELNKDLSQIFEIEEFIHKRKLNKDSREEGRDSILVNRDHYMNSLNLLTTVIQNKKNNRFSIIAIVVSISAIIISIIALYKSFIG